MDKRKDRKEEIINLLKSSNGPISGAELAEIFDVTRQVIVKDIALLKAQNYEILSTNRGYSLNEVVTSNCKFKKVIKVNHEDSDIEKELNIIVDSGAQCLDVFVWHKAYGKIQADLNIKSRRDVKKLIENINAGISKPLKKLTENYHYHTICAESEEIIAEVLEELKKENILLENDTET